MRSGAIASSRGLIAYCKPCHTAKGKETYTRLYGSTREYHLRRRYGIGQADVDRMLVEQEDKCAGCDKPDPEHVDHDHATGLVRGMLCFNCNQALGNVRDSVPVLDRLAAYLVKHRFLALGATLTESTVEGRLIEVVSKHNAG
jgi:Recombination endonuclease VII